jgi:thiamine biosynthesis lipoprotein
MGTLVAIEADLDTEFAACTAIEAAFAAIRRVESRMHPTRPGSDLAAIAAARIGQAVSVDPWTWHLLALAQRIAALSGVCSTPAHRRNRAGASLNSSSILPQSLLPERRSASILAALPKDSRSTRRSRRWSRQGLRRGS